MEKLRKFSTSASICPEIDLVSELVKRRKKNVFRVDSDSVCCDCILTWQ
jgi:hypothetical protein